ncbi:hypothetical protein QBC35DRAFT_472471 [Podospora australis]|uniref:Uncharacterized protein n=1 Tax=Podospora australis TaxID=1536484 RepID=A0AAN7AJM0_9PEZI|nr:hypothetical protein QBC35DRAFT_472471 [Podospora australis]
MEFREEALTPLSSSSTLHVSRCVQTKIRGSGESPGPGLLVRRSKGDGRVKRRDHRERGGEGQGEGSLEKWRSRRPWAWWSQRSLGPSPLPAGQQAPPVLSGGSTLLMIDLGKVNYEYNIGKRKLAVDCCDSRAPSLCAVNDKSMCKSDCVCQTDLALAELRKLLLRAGTNFRGPKSTRKACGLGISSEGVAPNLSGERVPTITIEVPVRSTAADSRPSG